MGAVICVVDAFTSSPFTGNPAAVCRLESFPSDGWMQSLASELRLSETAFVVPRPDGDHDLRWFTPAVEVDLCGHATLATAHLLGGSARFHTRSGPLTCTDMGDGWIAMDFPALVPTPVGHDIGLTRALGTADVYTVAKSRFDLLIELADADAVRSLRPDLAALGSLGARGYIVTAPGDGDRIDFVSRFFAPAAGIDEDPVTGSAHCVLGPFWSERLGRASLVGAQLSARGGIVRTRVDGDRVHLGGQAVTVWEGMLRVDPG
ncbi:MAG TPA: PhzF family phenazine biosynthesis protein [Acidimicrobiales bacterium]